MTHQEASSVVAAPLELVQQRLREVERWPEFLLGVSSVRKLSHERYRFAVDDRGEVDVCVSAHPKEHRISWRALSGPRFVGEIRMAAVDAGHTRVTLSMTADPAGFLAGLSEMLASSKSTATFVLQRLDGYVAAPRA